MALCKTARAGSAALLLVLLFSLTGAQTGAGGADCSAGTGEICTVGFSAQAGARAKVGITRLTPGTGGTQAAQSSRQKAETPSPAGDRIAPLPNWRGETLTLGLLAAR